MKRPLFLIIFLLSLTILLVAKNQIENYTVAIRNERPAVKILSVSFDSKIKDYVLGFQNLIVALTWIDLLQKADHTPIQNDEVSWEYLQLRTILELDRSFQQAYELGGPFLSVLRNDKIGALKILEKWIYHTPNQWKPNYLLAYHLYFEMQEHEKASKYMFKAASLEGAPDFLAALGVRLFSENRGILASLQLSAELYDRFPSARPRLKERIRHYNYTLQAQFWKEAYKSFLTKKGHPPHSFAELQRESPARRQIAWKLQNPEVEEILEEKFSFEIQGREIIPGQQIPRDWQETGIIKRKKNESH